MVFTGAVTMKRKILLSSYSAGYDRIWPLFALCGQPLVSTKVVRAITPIYIYRLIFEGID